jgi:hypothetical protein
LLPVPSLHLVLKYTSLVLGRAILYESWVTDSLYLGTGEEGVHMCYMEQYLKPVRPSERARNNDLYNLVYTMQL